MKHKVTFNALLVLALFLALAPNALASTPWYVNGMSGSDSHDCKSAQTACKTIHHAISLASSGDTITVAAAKYTENLTIGFSLKVTGSAASTTIIDGGYSGNVVFISNAAANITLSNLTIQHGSSQGGGGGIYNYGILTINNSTVANNSVFSQSKYPSFGGGIYNNNKLTINNSTISANYARGGVRSSGKGGGIYNGGGTVTMNNSTINGNGAPFGGGIYNSGALIISNTTFSGNSATSAGGIYNSMGWTVVLKNSIVANSPSGGNCSGNMSSHGYNLSSDGTCNFHNYGDRNNVVDPKLMGTLGYYGGPTQTIPLPSGSPAIDAGNPSGCTDGNGVLLKTDQRGQPRPNTEDIGDKKGCDIGAFERQSD